MYTITNSLTNIFAKIGAMLNTTTGWLLSLGMSLITFVGEEREAFYAVLAAIILDMFWGICVAVKRNRFVLSFLLRETGVKLLIYGSILLVMLNIERSIDDDWGLFTRAACALAAACELWSSCASMLIMKPDLIFIRLLKKYLKGEIASKLNCDKDELDKILNDGKH